MVGSALLTGVFTRFECCRTALAPYASSRDSQSQLQERRRTPRLPAANLSQYSATAPANHRILTPISIATCPFNYVPPCRLFFSQQTIARIERRVDRVMLQGMNGDQVIEQIRALSTPDDLGGSASIGRSSGRSIA